MDDTKSDKSELVQRLERIVEEIDARPSPETASVEDVVAMLNAASRLTDVAHEGALAHADDEDYGLVDEYLDGASEDLVVVAHALAVDHGLEPSHVDDDDTDAGDGDDQDDADDGDDGGDDAA